MSALSNTGLTLQCFERATDELIVGDDPGHAEPTICIYANTGRKESLTILNTAAARELFNWLGVWLHGGNRKS